MSSNRTPFTRLMERLDLEALSPTTFLGGAGAGGIGGHNRLFGGLVAAQATMAAQLACPNYPIHSLHAYFLRPGRAGLDIEFQVDITKSGRAFETALVTAKQEDTPIFQMLTSFHKAETGVEHADPMPQVPGPEGLPNRDELRGRPNWRDMPLDVRMATPITATQALPAEQSIWLKTNGELGNNNQLHVAMLVYASDRCLLDTAWRPHADTGQLAGASLDHSIWFHQPPDFNQWTLFNMHSPAASHARGLCFGAMYDQSGQRIASISQEGVLRRTPHP